MTRQVRIVNETGVGRGTKILDVEADGTEGRNFARMVSGVDIRISGVGEVNRATIEVGLVRPDVKAEAEFLIPHPEHGTLVVVKKIVLESGEEFNF